VSALIDRSEKRACISTTSKRQRTTARISTDNALSALSACALLNEFHYRPAVEVVAAKQHEWYDDKRSNAHQTGQVIHAARQEVS